jgi:hypothetical protein
LIALAVDVAIARRPVVAHPRASIVVPVVARPASRAPRSPARAHRSSARPSARHANVISRLVAVPRPRRVRSRRRAVPPPEGYARDRTARRASRSACCARGARARR